MYSRELSVTGVARITPEKRVQFIAGISDGMTAKAAAALTGIPREYYYHLKRDDPDFERQWRDAYSEGTEVLEAEAWRRAHQGVERRKPIVYRGAIIAEEVYREYSDTLLIFLLKSRDPATYRENIKHEISGRTEHEHRLTVKGDDDQLDRLASIAGILGQIGVLGPGRVPTADDVIDAEAYEVHPARAASEASRLPPA